MNDEKRTLPGWHVTALFGSSLAGAMGAALAVAAWSDGTAFARRLMEGGLRQPVSIGLFIGLAVGLFTFMVADVRARGERRLPATGWAWTVTGFAVGAAASGLLGWGMR